MMEGVLGSKGSIIARSVVLMHLFLILFCAVSLQGADLAVVGGAVYQSPEAPAISDGVILIHDGRITSVGPRSSVKIPLGIQRLDCSGSFVAAGFWNSHVHIFTPGLLHVNGETAAELNEQLDAMFNRWGFTTVFDIASVLKNTLALRSRINSGEIRGPRVLTVGEPLWTTPPIYISTFLAQNHIQIPVVSSPSEAATRVRALAQEGVNGIKLFAGSAQDGRVANMPLDMVRAATSDAHRHDLPVFAHPQNSEGLEVSIEGGVDILAHTALNSSPWNKAFVDRLKRAHMALIPTLTLFDFEARKAKVPDHEREQWINKVSDELRVFSEAGGQVIFGTDIGYTTHFDTALEFTLMAGAGMNFRQILASLTTEPARRLGYSDHSGRIAPGMDGDLTVLKGDPGADVRAFSRVQYTIRGGRVIYPSK